MTNEVTKLVDDTDDSREVGFVGDNPFLARTNSEGVTGGVFARFNGNTGSFLFGNEGEIEPNESVLCDLHNAKIGWLGFDADNKPHRGPETTFGSGEVLASPEPTPGIRWNKQVVFEIVRMDGSTALYSGKADKPSRPVLKLMREYGQKYQRQAEAPKVYKLPIVEFGQASFQVEITEEAPDGTKRKMKATKFREDFKIVNWYTHAEANDLRAMGGEPESDIAEEANEEGATVIEVVKGVEFPKETAKARPGAQPVRRNR